MKFYKEDVVNRVREKRKNENTSIRSLEKSFGIPSTTISRWVRDIKNSNPNFLKAREIEKASRSTYLTPVQKIKFDAERARTWCSLLYWCEGSKHPSTNFVAFANSDEKLICSFLFLLRKGFRINEKKLRVQLQLHSTHDEKTSISYWSRLLDVPKGQFQKSTITNPAKTMKRRSYSGTCTVKYFDVKLLLGIMGLYESFFNEVYKEKL